MTIKAVKANVRVLTRYILFLKTIHLADKTIKGKRNTYITYSKIAFTQMAKMKRIPKAPPIRIVFFIEASGHILHPLILKMIMPKTIG